MKYLYLLLLVLFMSSCSKEVITYEDSKGKLTNESYSYAGDIRSYYSSKKGFVIAMPHGQGEILYSYGDNYRGGFKDGVFFGKGAIIYPDGRSYIGTWVNGSYHGQGIERLPDGSKYIGNWQSGERHGQGQLFIKGYEIVGIFNEGSSLKCTTLAIDEYCVEGNCRSGLGKWDNGMMSYTGEYKDGLYEGKGILIFANGDKYIGGFSAGKMNGNGKFYGNSNSFVITGHWRLNKWSGGSKVYSDGRAPEILMDAI